MVKKKEQENQNDVPGAGGIQAWAKRGRARKKKVGVCGGREVYCSEKGGNMK